MNKQELIETIRANRPLLDEFSVKSVSVFGSIVRDEARPDSDVDILVEFDPNAKVGFFTFARLQRRLSEVLRRPIDLVTPDALHKSMKTQILKEAVHAV